MATTLSLTPDESDKKFISAGIYDKKTRSYEDSALFPRGEYVTLESAQFLPLPIEEDYNMEQIHKFKTEDGDYKFVKIVGDLTLSSCFSSDFKKDKKYPCKIEVFEVPNPTLTRGVARRNLHSPPKVGGKRRTKQARNRRRRRSLKVTYRRSKQ